MLIGLRTPRYRFVMIARQLFGLHLNDVLHDAH